MKGIGAAVNYRLIVACMVLGLVKYFLGIWRLLRYSS